MQSLRRQEYTTAENGKRVLSISGKKKVAGFKGFG
jgi:hypothetical protein